MLEDGANFAGLAKKLSIFSNAKSAEVLAEINDTPVAAEPRIWKVICEQPSIT